jgi:DNA-binding transcriptional LysR family regulator
MLTGPPPKFHGTWDILSRPSDGCLQYSGRSSWRFPVLARYAQAVRTMADYAAEGSGVVRLGIPLELPPTVLPGTLSRFAAHCPHARVVPTHLSTAAQIAALRSDDLDVGLVRERPAGSEFDAMLVVRESLGILIASDVAANSAAQTASRWMLSAVWIGSGFPGLTLPRSAICSSRCR